MANEMILKLHDRATRGEQLTAAEQTQLAHWYAAEDEAERKSLTRHL